MEYINYMVILFMALLRQCTGGDTHLIEQHNHNFDVLIFTQRWPVTACLLWLESGDKHTCALPSPKEIWTIHGIWPTKFGTVGPAFCNSTAKFNPDELAPFETQLQQFWLNIEREIPFLHITLKIYYEPPIDTPLTSLWKHEWLKHGTCASVLPELSNENKYFGQGLSWLQQYSMSSILQKGGVIPDSDNITFVSVHRAINNVLKINPSVHCIRDPINEELYLSEIRICFNKSLELIDCDGVKLRDDDDLIETKYVGGTFITNCELSRKLKYLSMVPKSLTDASINNINYNNINDNNNNFKNNDKMGWRFSFVNFYKLIQLIQWMTI